MSSSQEVQINKDSERLKNNKTDTSCCPYCEINSEGAIWLEWHLAGIGGDIPACPDAPTNVRNVYEANLRGKMTNENIYHEDNMETEVNRNGKRSRTEESSNGILSRLESSQENLISDIITEKDSREAKRSVGRFLYENGLDSSVVNSPSFRSMISRFPCVDGLVPTQHELDEWVCSENLKEMEDYNREVKSSWKETGCSILLDEWVDQMGRSLMNVLTDCPRGTLYMCSHDISECRENLDAMLCFIDKIVTEVGLTNVVQIVTNSTSDFMKQLGQRVMAKHRSLFWTVSVSSCIDLMLEQMGDLDLFKKTLENAKIITRFIYSRPSVLKLFQDYTDGENLVVPSRRSFLPFLTLENMVSEEVSLKAIFQSDSKLSSSLEGKKVANLVLGRSFWNAAVIVVKATIPLVRVMDWMDKNKSHTGHIYETLDQAKEEIEVGIEQSKKKIGGGVKKKYGHETFWAVVDDIWNNHLHSHLHSGGYFLNPAIYDSNDVHRDPEISLGMSCCIVRSSANPNIQDTMMMQLENYQDSMDKSAEGCGVEERKNVPPALWWETHGEGCPELQRLAVRILSQTCDGATKFRLQSSLAENLLVKGMTHQMEDKKLVERVGFKYNMELKGFVPSTTYCPSPEDIEQMNDWVLSKPLTGQ